MLGQMVDPAHLIGTGPCLPSNLHGVVVDDRVLPRAYARSPPRAHPATPRASICSSHSRRAVAARRASRRARRVSLRAISPPTSLSRSAKGCSYCSRNNFGLNAETRCVSRRLPGRRGQDQPGMSGSVPAVIVRPPTTIGRRARSGRSGIGCSTLESVGSPPLSKRAGRET